MVSTIINNILITSNCRCHLCKFFDVIGIYISPNAAPGLCAGAQHSKSSRRYSSPGEGTICEGDFSQRNMVIQSSKNWI